MIAHTAVQPLRPFDAARPLLRLYDRARRSISLGRALEDAAAVDALARTIGAHMPISGSLLPMARGVLAHALATARLGTPLVPLTEAIVAAMAGRLDRGIAEVSAGHGVLDARELAIWLLRETR